MENITDSTTLDAKELKRDKFDVHIKEERIKLANDVLKMFGFNSNEDRNEGEFNLDKQANFYDQNKDRMRILFPVPFPNYEIDKPGKIFCYYLYIIYEIYHLSIQINPHTGFKTCYLHVAGQSSHRE